MDMHTMNHSTSQIGKWGEQEGTQYLLEQGYQILFNNWRAERGDIDIVALDKNCLVFIEVKGGSSEKYGPPELRITENKKRQLRKLASLFLAGEEVKKIDFQECRFDVLVVDGNRHKYNVRHFQNAFSSSF
jgi:putative endonuclease